MGSKNGKNKNHENETEKEEKVLDYNDKNELIYNKNIHNLRRNHKLLYDSKETYYGGCGWCIFNLNGMYDEKELIKMSKEDMIKIIKLYIPTIEYDITDHKNILSELSIIYLGTNNQESLVRTVFNDILEPINKKIIDDVEYNVFEYKVNEYNMYKNIKINNDYHSMELTGFYENINNNFRYFNSGDMYGLHNKTLTIYSSKPNIDIELDVIMFNSNVLNALKKSHFIDFKHYILYYCGKAYKIDKNTIPNILLE